MNSSSFPQHDGHEATGDLSILTLATSFLLNYYMALKYPHQWETGLLFLIKVKYMIHFHHMVLHGLLLILIGLFIRFKVGQRRFKRRTVTGMELYSSYAKGVITRCLEGVAAFSGRILILVGLVLVIAGTV
ncbi:MAG TPA: hypothetical protein VHE34_21220 [Puia sp.]|uniref:hypothetical protein n=1 Tax=Puia sp. TaxID=2045100 RepID=UPI002B8AC27D|nr:hypothetical protein [Puia sp.]HVU97765.1 hypothetical protein [Puia sp.]